jgi:hypothetical protein
LIAKSSSSDLVDQAASAALIAKSSDSSTDLADKQLLSWAALIAKSSSSDNLADQAASAALIAKSSDSSGFAMSTPVMGHELAAL